MSSPWTLARDGVVPHCVYSCRMSFMRSFIAFTLLLVAVVVGFGGMGAQWLDRLARTPAPMQRIVGPLASDPQVVGALKDTLVAETRRAVPTELLAHPVIGAQVDGVVNLAVDAALADPGMQRAWNESINRSRAAYVAELDRVHRDEALESPTIWFDLTPLVDLGRSRLTAVAPEALHTYLDQVQFDEARLPLGQPDASTSRSVADGVAAARNWPWLYLASGVLVVVAMFTGSRRGRWVALALASVVAVVGLWFGRSVVETVSFPGGDSLAAAIRTGIVNGGTQSFLDFTQTGLHVAYTALALGVLGLVVASLSRKAG